MSKSQLIIDQEAALAEFFARGGVVNMLDKALTERERREERHAKQAAKAAKDAAKQERKAARAAKAAARQLAVL